jgi:hypothetical protein
MTFGLYFILRFEFLLKGVDAKPVLTGDTRTWRVWLDPNQYQADIQDTLTGGEDVYDTFNVLMRRKPKENEYKCCCTGMVTRFNIRLW